MGIEAESTTTTDPMRTESTQSSSRAPRLFIKEMVMKNFKSYAGEQRVGPFHKVRGFHLSFLTCFELCGIMILKERIVT